MFRTYFLIFGVACMTIASCAATEKRAPKDLKIKGPEGNCTVFTFTYTGRDGIVRGMSSTKPTINGIQRRIKGIEPGELPDILIGDGWVYVIGSQVSAGTKSHAIAAVGTKLVVDANETENPRLMHISGGGDDVRAWPVGNGARAQPVTADHQRLGFAADISRTEVKIADDDKILEEIRAACAACKWPEEDWP